MADQSLSKQLGASPKKLVLVGVLAVILAAVLYRQFVMSSDDEALAPRVASRAERLPRTKAANTKNLTPAGTTGGKSSEWLIETVDRRQWKSPALSDVVRYDPFALPAAFPQPVVAAVPGMKLPDGTVVSADATMDVDKQAEVIAGVQTKLAELQQRGVRVIIQGRKQAAAVIGDRTVHVGDDVDGFTVKAIQADGVVVERKLE